MNGLTQGPIRTGFQCNGEDRLVAELSASERRRIALASLTLLERQCVLRLAQIRADRRALLAQAGAR
jgi:ABC-type transport system involved in cytochrome c biogenesis ATPase subunit